MEAIAGKKPSITCASIVKVPRSRGPARVRPPPAPDQSARSGNLCPATSPDARGAACATRTARASAALGAPRRTRSRSPICRGARRARQSGLYPPPRAATTRAHRHTASRSSAPGASNGVVAMRVYAAPPSHHCEERRRVHSIKPAARHRCACSPSPHTHTRTHTHSATHPPAGGSLKVPPPWTVSAPDSAACVDPRRAARDE